MDFTSSTVIPAASRARTTVLARPPPLRTGARSRRPSWLKWTGSDANGSRAPEAAGLASVSVTSSLAPPGLRLELGGRPFGDDVTVVDDHDPVGELVRLVEVLGGQQ